MNRFTAKVNSYYLKAVQLAKHVHVDHDTDLTALVRLSLQHSNIVCMRICPYNINIKQKWAFSDQINASL